MIPEETKNPFYRPLETDQDNLPGQWSLAVTDVDAALENGSTSTVRLNLVNGLYSEFNGRLTNLIDAVEASDQEAINREVLEIKAEFGEKIVQKFIVPRSFISSENLTEVPVNFRDWARIAIELVEIKTNDLGCHELMKKLIEEGDRLKRETDGRIDLVLL